MCNREGLVTIEAERDDAIQGYRISGQMRAAYSGKAVEVQLTDHNAIAQYRVGRAEDLIGLFG